MKSHSLESSFHPGAAIAAWIIPGLGHLFLGQAARGVILFFSISSIFITGVLIGGVDVFDRNKPPLAAYAQIGIAPTLILSQIVMVTRHNTRDFSPDAHPPYTPALAKSEEQGLVFVGVAGLLNFLAVMDAFYRAPRRRGQTQAAQAAPGSGTGATAVARPVPTSTPPSAQA